MVLAWSYRVEQVVLGSPWHLRFHRQPMSILHLLWNHSCLICHHQSALWVMHRHCHSRSASRRLWPLCGPRSGLQFSLQAAATPVGTFQLGFHLDWRWSWRRYCHAPECDNQLRRLTDAYWDLYLQTWARNLISEWLHPLVARHHAFLHTMAAFSFSFVQDCSWWPHVARSPSQSRPYSDQTSEWRSSWQFSNFLSRFFPAQLYANWSVSSLLWTLWLKSSGSFRGISVVRSWWASCQQISQPASWGVSDCHAQSPPAAQIVYTSGSSTYCGKTSLSHLNWIEFIFELQFWPFYDPRYLLTFTRESSKPYIRDP